MGDQLKNAMIGLFVIAAFAIIVFIMLFLHPNIGNEGQILRVRFADIDKITPGTRVSFGGKPVGEVIEIKEIKRENGERIEHDGIIYVYELTLAIDSGTVVYVTDEITSRTSGLLGEKSVAITPIPPKRGEELVRVRAQILYAMETGSVESTLKDFSELSSKIELALDGFIDALDTLKETKLWENVGFTMENIGDITAALNQPEKIHAIIDGTDSVVQNIEDMAIALNEPEKITQIIDNFVSTSNSAKEISTLTEKGEGSLGKIVVKDDFYLRLSSLMSKAETVLNDVNHYGVLFHLDKGWQRLRARRLNLLAQLKCPEEFRNYFNDEIDMITTSLERVAMVIEKTTDECSCWGLWQNPEYVKVYAELLRRVAMVEEYLQMYNQQVVDCEVQQTELR